MLYFLGVVTGGVQALAAKYKVACNFVLEGEDETSSARKAPPLLEEDVIVHENYFTLASFLEFTPLNSAYNSADVPDVLLTMVAPPPERA